MAIKYQAGFNSGELSPKLYGRSDLDIYKNGCSRLENFFVLPQGGIERRPGTVYIDETADITLDTWVTSTDYVVGDKVVDGVTDYICLVNHTSGTFATDLSNGLWETYAIPTAGTESCRLIPFTFSSSQAYAIEIGNGYARAWKSDGTYVNISGTIPYAEADVRDIDYYQRFDILYLSHPDHPVQELKRLTTTPTFSISELQYDYPPTLDENDTGTSLTPTYKYDAWGTGTVYNENDIIRQDGSD
jgi:hypothetical protein